MQQFSFFKEHQYARWMAAFRLASRGRSMADATYQTEVESIKNLLQMQSGGMGCEDPTCFKLIIL